MRGALVAMVLAAACGGSGVDLEVTSSAAFDHVEVFIGTDNCYTTDPDTQQQVECPGVAWKPGQIRPPGDVYVMKPDEKVIATYEVSGSTATMHLEATAEYREPLLIAVVAFSGDTAVAFAKLHGVRIPANSAEHWKVELDPADVATDELKRPPPESGSTERVYAWARQRVDDPSVYSRCLVMQFWDDQNKIWVNKFIVPYSDPDCDGQDIECDPLYANFNTSGSPHLCVTPAPDILQTPCAIGGSQCADGLSDTYDCTLPADGLTCIPQALCTDCEGAGDTLACLISQFALPPPDPTLTEFKCVFHAQDGGGNCSTEQTVNSTQFYLPVACKDVEVRDSATPFASSGSPNRIDIGNPGQASINVSISNVATSTCVITLYWNDGVIEPLTLPRKTVVFVVSSSTTNNTIAFPVHVEWGIAANSCDSSGTVSHSPCGSLGTNASKDTMYECLR